jgi:hypothetical protein
VIPGSSKVRRISIAFLGWRSSIAFKESLLPAKSSFPRRLKASNFEAQKYTGATHRVVSSFRLDRNSHSYHFGLGNGERMWRGEKDAVRVQVHLALNVGRQLQDTETAYCRKFAIIRKKSFAADC